jgi:VanZ family protein
MLVLAIWIFAAADEIAQGWIEGRSASLGDWIADMVGVLIGLMLAPLVLRPLLRLLMR